jgi:hypothetical protein
MTPTRENNQDIRWSYIPTDDLIWSGLDSDGRLHKVYDVIQYDPERDLCLFKRIPNNKKCELYQSGWTNEMFERDGDTWRRVVIDENHID